MALLLGPVEDCQLDQKGGFRPDLEEVYPPDRVAACRQDLEADSRPVARSTTSPTCLRGPVSCRSLRNVGCRTLQA